MLIRTQNKATIIDITGKQQVLDSIEIAWSKWVPGCSPAYHMPEANGVSDMSDMEKAEAIQKSKAMTPDIL